MVIDVLQQAVYDHEERGAGSSYFREPLDIVLGIVDEEGDFLVFYLDSRRFEPFGT